MNAYKILIVGSKEYIPLGRPSIVWEDIIKVDFGEIGCEVLTWSHVARDRDRWRALCTQ
jgi:hypothetical protein